MSRRSTTMLLLVTAASTLACGCASYGASPLNSDPRHRELAVPSEPALQVLVSELHDPELATVVIDLGDGVGPDEAAVLSVVLNPSLRALRATRGIARAEILSAGLLPDPTLSVAPDIPAFGATPGSFTGYGVGLDWAISDLIDRPARRTAACRNKDAVDLGILWHESLIAAKARGLVYGLAAAQMSLSLLDEEISLLEGNASRVRTAVASGHMTAVDMAAAQASLDAAHTQRANLAEALRQARIDLATLMGFPPDADLRAGVGLMHVVAAPTPPLASLIETMTQHRLDLRALRRGYESQESRVRAAVLRQFPRISLGPTFARDTGNLSSFGIGIGIELPVFNANRGEIANERATREMLSKEYVARVHEARSELATELNRLTSSQARMRSLDEAERSQASLVKKYGEGLKLGHVDVLSYYGARRDLIETRIARAQSAAEIHTSRLMIELLAGERWHSEPGHTQVPAGVHQP